MSSSSIGIQEAGALFNKKEKKMTFNKAQGQFASVINAFIEQKYLQIIKLIHIFLYLVHLGATLSHRDLQKCLGA